jgi:MFS family permease
MKGSCYAWFLVALLWVVLLLNYLDRQVIFALFPLLRAGLHLRDYQLGLIPTAFLWVYAVVSPLAGFLGDRFGRKRVIVASLFAWSLVSAALGQVKSFPQLLMGVSLLGIIEACYLPSGLALIADYHGERTRALATGLHQSGAYVGMVAGGMGGGWVGEHYGWRPVFVMLGAAGVAYSLFALWAVRENADRQRAATNSGAISLWPAMRELLHLPGFRTVTVVFCVAGMANWLLYSWMPLYLYERFHMSLGRAGFSATFFIQIGSAGGILLGGWLADHYSARSTRSRIFTQAAGVAVSAPFLLLVGATGSAAFLLVALVVFGIGKGAYDANCMPVLCQIAPARLRSTGYGLFNCAGSMAGGAVAAAAGALKATFGLGVTIEATGLLLFAAAALLLRVHPAPQPAPSLAPEPIRP